MEWAVSSRRNRAGVRLYCGMGVVVAGVNSPVVFLAGIARTVAGVADGRRSRVVLLSYWACSWQVWACCKRTMVDPPGSPRGGGRVGAGRRDARETREAADTLRIRLPNEAGIFLVYDAANPPENPRRAAGYLAYWNDFETRRVYVFGRLVFAPPDVGHALLNLERDLLIDAGALAGLDPNVRAGFADAALEPEDPAEWSAATHWTMRELMGFEGGVDDLGRAAAAAPDCKYTGKPGSAVPVHASRTRWVQTHPSMS